jgi:hypothetical protein
MDSAFLPADISVATVATATLPYLFTKPREREADWRKMKLDQYNEYVTALSGIVEGRDTPHAHIRYVDAVNSLTLVASVPVRRALRLYLDYSSSRNMKKCIERHDELLTNLIRPLRQDVYPRRQNDDASQIFRLITVPPDMRSSHSLQSGK